MAPVFYSMDHALNFFFLDHWQQSRKIKPAEKKNTWFILVYDSPALYKENCALGLVEYVFSPYRPPTQ